MKFVSLFFLIGCAFGQNLFYWPFPYFVQHPASAVSNGRSEGQYWARNDHLESFDGDVDDAMQTDQVMARTKLREGLNSISKRKQENKFQQAKFNDYARFLSTRATSTSTSTFTYTSTSITTTYGTTTTITQTLTKTCFPSTQLALTASTLPCRRKRDIPLILEQIEPTPNINQVETTLLVDATEDRIRRDVESSQDLLVDLVERQGASSLRFGFNILSSILFVPAPTTTTTTTIMATTTTTTIITIPTNYVVISTFTTKKINLADTGKLLCSPISYSTCL